MAPSFLSGGALLAFALHFLANEVEDFVVVEGDERAAGDLAIADHSGCMQRVGSLAKDEDIVHDHHRGAITRERLAFGASEEGGLAKFLQDGFRFGSAGYRDQGEADHLGAGLFRLQRQKSDGTVSLD